MPERGFKYFSSPPGSDDAALIAHELLYCRIAVVEWPSWRSQAEQTGVLSTQRCQAIEAHAISNYLEFANAITASLPPLATVLWSVSPELAVRLVNAVHSHPWLAQRVICAHAYVALYAAPEALPVYRQTIAPAISDARQDEFNHILLSGKWDVHDKSPARVIGAILRAQERSKRRAKATERKRWAPIETLHALESASVKSPESSVIAGIDWERGRKGLDLSADVQRAVEARLEGMSLRSADAPEYFNWTPKHLDSVRRSLEPGRRIGDMLRAYFMAYQHAPNRTGSRQHKR